MSDIVYSQAYDRLGFDPPMPVLEIGLSRPGSSEAIAVVHAIVDTGADGTLIPRDILEQASGAYVDRTFLRGIIGERQPVDLYLVTLHLGSLVIAGARVVAMPVGTTAIIGRDVLNQLHLDLNGPAGVTTVLA